MAMKKDLSRLLENDDTKYVKIIADGEERDFKEGNPERNYLFCFKGEEFKKFLTSGEKKLRLEKAGWLQRQFDKDVFGFNKIVGSIKSELLKAALEDDKMSFNDFKTRWAEIYKLALGDLTRICSGI